MFQLHGLDKTKDQTRTNTRKI